MKPKRAGAVARRIWFDRKFALGLPRDAFPDLLERIRGTPARLEERVRGLDRAMLTRRIGESWSIQENVGHLGDMEALWAGRLGDFLEGRDALRPADLKNTRTHEARHNDASVEALLLTFRRERFGTVERLEAMGASDLDRTALHPRLSQPMSIVDHFFFVAEHDDHHLAAIAELIRAFRTA
ncbi:MAG TPA: DinB family protein [Gemmatimonadales bacterium]